jgi:hippurate hydrolase
MSRLMRPGRGFSAQWLVAAAFIVTCAVSAPTQGREAGITEQMDRVAGLIDADAARLEKLFKDLHQHPELGFMETRTAGILAKELKALGFQVQTGIGKTGVVGVLKNGEGPTVMYRADMDANAVEEATGLPYASKVRVRREDGSESPVAHMCGHDVHVTWMIGMAKAMVALKDQWQGTLVLVGQPAEEMILGAQAMVNDGLWTDRSLPKPDYFIAMHTAAGPVGVVVSSGGPKMAGTDQIDILFRGVGGHGSMPHLTKDPVLMAAYAVTQYQSIVSHLIDPQATAVLAVGSIQAGADNNVIPSTALVKANLRWYDPKVREQMIAGLRDISNGIARTYGVPEDELPVITMKGGSTPLVNDDALAARLAVPLKALLGDANVVTDLPPATGSEDAHLLLGSFKDVPFNYLVVGVADPVVFAAARKAGKEIPYSLHNPDFMVDLKSIPVGTKVATISMLELLAHQ